MSPGGAIFFLPFHPKESAFLPCLQAMLDACCHPWATLPDCQFQEALRMVMIGQVAGFSRLLQTGGVRTRWVSTGLARGGGEGSTNGGNPASRLSAATGCQSSTRFDPPRVMPTQKSHPERAKKLGGRVVAGDRSAGPLTSPGLSPLPPGS